MIVVDTYEREPVFSNPRRCAHPTCRTSLDEYAVECPHGRPFCEACVWEEGCADCDIEPLRAAYIVGLGDTPRHVMSRSEELQGHKAEQRRDEREGRV